jgi:hypothetical protein
MLLYWTFDTVAAGNYVDSSQGVLFVPTAAPTVTGKIGNGVQLVGAGSSLLDADLTNVGAPLLAPYSGGGVSHAFWANMSAHGGGFPTELVATVLSGNDGHQYEMSFRPGLGGVENNISFDMIQDPLVLGPTVLTVTVPITWVLNSWFFFAFIYKQSTGKFSVSVNNGAANVSAGTFFLPNGTWVNDHPSSSFLASPTITLDEYMIHTGKELSASQITNLFNGGAGVTWPAAGAIVS